MTCIQVAFPWDTMATCLAFTKVVEGRLRLSKRDLLKNGAATQTNSRLHYAIVQKTWKNLENHWIRTIYEVGPYKLYMEL